MNKNHDIKTDISSPVKHKVAEIKHLIKTYGTKGFQTKVLKGIDLTIYKHDFIAIMGPSGSGKTTLLNILSTGLDYLKTQSKDLPVHPLFCHHLLILFLFLLTELLMAPRHPVCPLCLDSC